MSSVTASPIPAGIGIPRVTATVALLAVAFLGVPLVADDYVLEALLTPFLALSLL